MTERKYIVKRYFGARNPGSYGSLTNFLRNSRYKDKDYVEKVLKSLKTYTIHRPRHARVKKREYRHVFPMFRGDIMAMDLADVNNWNPRLNGGIKFLLVITDVFTREIFVYGLKNKEGDTVAAAIDKHMKQNKDHHNSKIWSDMGLEFRAKTVIETLKKYGCIRYSTKNLKIKASPV